MICKIDLAVWGAGGGAVLRARRPGTTGHAVWEGACESDGQVLPGVLFGLLVEVLLKKKRVMAGC